MSGEASGSATPPKDQDPGETGGGNPGGTGEGTGGDNPGTDPREAELGDKGKELLKELRGENKNLAKQVKELLERQKSDDDAKAKAKADKDKADADAAKAKADAEKTEIEKLQERLARSEARALRADFMDAVEAAGIRDGQAARDLYTLVKDEIGDDPDKIADVVAKQLDARPSFFKEKKGTKGTDGGAGGGGKGPVLTSDEKKAAAMLGVSEEDYIKMRDQS